MFFRRFFKHIAYCCFRLDACFADADRRKLEVTQGLPTTVSQKSVLLAALSPKRIILVLILAGCRRTAVSPVNGTVQGLSIILCEQSCDQLVKLLIN